MLARETTREEGEGRTVALLALELLLLLPCSSDVLAERGTAVSDKPDLDLSEKDECVSCDALRRRREREGGGRTSRPASGKLFIFSIATMASLCSLNLRAQPLRQPHAHAPRERGGRERT